MTQLRDIINSLQQINTAHIDESAADDPAFRKWWKSNSHRFPECLMSAIATGFVAGWVNRINVEELKKSILQKIKAVVDEKFQEVDGDV